MLLWIKRPRCPGPVTWAGRFLHSVRGSDVSWSGPPPGTSQRADHNTPRPGSPSINSVPGPCPYSARRVPLRVLQSWWLTHHAVPGDVSQGIRHLRAPRESLRGCCDHSPCTPPPPPVFSCVAPVFCSSAVTIKLVYFHGSVVTRECVWCLTDVQIQLAPQNLLFWRLCVPHSGAGPRDRASPSPLEESWLEEAGQRPEPTVHLSEQETLLVTTLTDLEWVWPNSWESVCV